MPVVDREHGVVDSQRQAARVRLAGVAAKQGHAPAAHKVVLRLDHHVFREVFHRGHVRLVAIHAVGPPPPPNRAASGRPKGAG